MTDKTVNILLYKQGYFGNIVKFLLSLDKISYPFLPINEPYDESKLRSFYLNFDNIRWKYGSWQKFHDAFGAMSTKINGVCKDLDDFLPSRFKNLTVYGHPIDIDLFLKTNTDKISNLKINYLTTNLSSPYEIIIKDFLTQNNNWPYLTMQDISLYNNMVKKYKPYTINLDNFVTGTANFLIEYDKLNQVCGLNPNIDEALIVYKSWTNARKLYQYDFFKV